MPVDRKLLTQSFGTARLPNWKCPQCAGGHFRLVPESFFHSNDGRTEQNKGEEWFDYDDFRLVFTALARCDNDECREAARVAGEGGLFEDPDLEQHRMDYSELFAPNYVSPSPPLIAVPEECPETVVDQIRKANVAQWGDYDAALMHLRIAVERLLDAQNVVSTRTTPKGRSYLSLHDRIDLFRAQRPKEADALLAAKWLGNPGAHNEEVTRGDVFDMYDILERVLDLLYGNASVLEKLISSINAAKGPARLKW